MLSRSCSTVRAPRITEVTPGCAATQARATWDDETACASATSATVSRIRQVRSLAFRASQASIPRSGFSPSRVAPVGGTFREYFPLSQPPPRGDHGSSPRPASSAAGTISCSMPRTSRLYCGCSVTGAAQPWRSASITAFVSCQPVKFENPE
jgi:hypothetical protein